MSNRFFSSGRSRLRPLNLESQSLTSKYLPSWSCFVSSHNLVCLRHLIGCKHRHTCIEWRILCSSLTVSHPLDTPLATVTTHSSSSHNQQPTLISNHHARRKEDSK